MRSLQTHHFAGDAVSTIGMWVSTASMQLQVHFVMLELLSLALGCSDGCSSRKPFLSIVGPGPILPHGFSTGKPLGLNRPSIPNTFSATARAVSMDWIIMDTDQCHVEHMRADQKTFHQSNPQPRGWRSTFCLYTSRRQASGTMTPWKSLRRLGHWRSGTVKHHILSR